MEQPSSIYFDNVSLKFNSCYLFRNFSLKIEGGKCTCLLGPSGCGKSTMLGLISGNMQLKSRGRVHFSQKNEREKSISWMAQTDLLLPWLKVRDNVTLGAKLRSELTENLRKKADQLLFEVGLGDYGDALPDELSGGMRQRVALLRTLMEDRQIILMDEPFSALDALTRMKLQNLSAEMTKGRTVVMVTHDPMEALRLADRIIVLGEIPVQVISEIELEGSGPRSAENSVVQENYPKLLNLLLQENRKGE